MKKLVLTLLILSMVIGLSGCSTIAVGYVENSSSGKMSASYISLTGTKECNLTVEDGETVDINADIVTKKGSIDVYIYEDEEDYDYEGHDLETSDFTVTLSEPGDYTIKVDTHNHKGSYSFQWKK